MKITALIVAGGRGTRMGADRNKVFLTIGGREIIHFTVSAFEWNKNIDEIVIVTGAGDIETCEEIVRNSGFKKVACIIEGGSERQKSVYNGLKKATGDIVLIHDGARALVTDKEIDAAVEDCIHFGAAAVGVKSKDTLKSADPKGYITGTIDRENTYLIQTPQAFYTADILSMHEMAAKEGFKATDDCMIAEHYGKRIKISAGSYDNIKLTTPVDMIIAEEILKGRGDIE